MVSAKKIVETACCVVPRRAAHPATECFPPPPRPSIHPVRRPATDRNAVARHPGPVRNSCKMCSVEAVSRSFRREIPCFRSQAGRHLPQRANIGWFRPVGSGVWPARERRSGRTVCPARSPSEFDSARGCCLLVFSHSTYTNEMPWGKVPKNFAVSQKQFFERDGRARHSVRAAVGLIESGAHGVTRPTATDSCG